ncbi:MAG: methylated-DNA--[protein]-cysteine S-methyltransferase [Acidobacteriota bacterium]|nr:methylated-DNA--[protein]-cysteine S-methyltransferase [Acidobacteriota bacterium]
MKIYYHSPLGTLELSGGEKGLETCGFLRKNQLKISPGEMKTSLKEAPEALARAWRELDDYFHGKRRSFSLKLSLQGTGFQKRVWQQLKKIPYGETRTYGEIAAACGKPKAARAVGQANHQNSLVIIIPCHRVIGSDGSLVGFGGGLWRKKWLLAHEKKMQEKKSYKKSLKNLP